MLNTILEIKFGSHLYGTNSETSDTDIKGIFMPTKKEILLGRIPKSIVTTTKKVDDVKNTSEDVDVEMFSLHYFIKLACEGQTVALDMLHAPLILNYYNPYCTIVVSLLRNRDRFYTKNLNAFVGYCRKQASKYGVKGSRLADAKKVLDKFYMVFCMGNPRNKLSVYWDELPEGEHISKYYDEDTKLNMYEVCGRKIQETASIEYAYDIVKRFYDNYGERAKKAEKNEGIDWKAVSHAVRVAYEMIEIFEDGKITFPLKTAEYIKQVKYGKLDYLTEVAPTLDKLMERVEHLSSISTYPEKVDREFWDNWLYDMVEQYAL